MQKLFGSQYDDSAPSSGARALEMIDALYNLEMRANILALRQERRKARLQRSIAQWVEYWPVCAGILLSMVAPQMREFVEPFRPWGLWVSFPIVALSIRPEIYLGSHISAVLPAALTYLQFPLEGLLAENKKSCQSCQETFCVHSFLPDASSHATGNSPAMAFLATRVLLLGRPPTAVRSETLSPACRAGIPAGAELLFVLSHRRLGFGRRG